MRLNPYKFRLWLDSLSANILNARQKELLLWLLAWGKAGCDSYNYRLAKEMRCCVRTIRYDLRKLERYHLIVIRGALGKYRRIIVLPYATSALWKSNSFTNMCREMGAKFCRHQRRILIKTKYTTRTRGKTPQEREENLIADNLRIAQEQRQELLYGTKKNAESAKTADGVLPRGETPRTPPAAQGNYERILELAKRGYIDRFVRMGYSRQRAISLAEAKIECLVEKRKSQGVQSGS